MILAGLASCPATLRAAEGAPAPIAAYGDLRLAQSLAGRKDLEVERERDHADKLFTYRRDGSHDIKAMSDFLAGTSGRLLAMYDQIGSYDLTPPKGTIGPLLDVGSLVDGHLGLVFDNGGGFQGNPDAYHRPYHATALANPDLETALRTGVTLIAELRVGNSGPLAGELLTLGPAASYPLLLFAGHPGSKRTDRDANDVTALFGRFEPLAGPLPSTRSVLAVAIDANGHSALAGSQRRDLTSALPDNVTWRGLLLGTRQPRSGDGWELTSLLVFSRRLSSADLQHVAASLLPSIKNTDATIVLDGSSLEVGMGSTELRNLTRLYQTSQLGPMIFNVAVGGATIEDRLAALPSTLSVLAGSQGPEILICGAGANSLAHGVSAADAYRQIGQYVSIAHTADPALKVGLTTIVPLAYGIGAGFGDQFVAYNRMVRSNSAGADFIIDRSKDPIMGDPATVWPHIDLRYSTDGTHPTDAGYQRIADIDNIAIKTELDMFKHASGQRQATR